MTKQIGYRIPDNQKPCKFAHHYQEVLGERWMGSCNMFECLYEGDKVIDDDCAWWERSKCIAYEPCETKICQKHDIEFYVDGDWCELCLEDEPKRWS